jgi:hypothetical protein
MLTYADVCWNADQQVVAAQLLRVRALLYMLTYADVC